MTKELKEILDKRGYYNTDLIAEIESIINLRLSEQQSKHEQEMKKGMMGIEFKHYCGNMVTEKEVFFDHCLKCGEYFSDDGE